MKEFQPSKEQLDIVQTKERSVQVFACPGSGKTTMVVRRIKYLVDQGANPEEIVWIPYSREDRRRSEDALRRAGLPVGLAENGVVVKTLDGFGLSVARGMKSNAKLAKTKEVEAAVLWSVTALIACIKSKKNSSMELGRKTLKAVKVLGRPDRKSGLEWLAEINSVEHKSVQLVVDVLTGRPEGKRSEKRRPSQFNALRQILVEALVRETRRKLWSEGSLTFFDMTRRATRVVEKRGPTGLGYKYVFVDEWQDAGPNHIQLVNTMAKRDSRLHLMVLGDPNQSIFEYRGASFSPLDGAVSLPLCKSFRLTYQNARLANLILRNVAVTHSGGQPFAITASKSGPKPTFYSFEAAVDMNAAVAQQIAELLATGVPGTDIAVIARTKKELPPLEREFWARALPTQHPKRGRKFLPHLEAVMKLAYLIERAGGGEKKTVEPKKRATKLSLNEEIVKGILEKVDLELGDSDPWASDRGADLCLELSQFRGSARESMFKAATNAYLRSSGGIRHEPELRNWLRHFDPVVRQLDLGWKAAHAKLKGIVDNPASGVTFTTLHGAKGGEWPYVFAIGLVEGGWPINKAKTKSERDAELRTIYVAVTRAKKEVRLFGGTRTDPSSRTELEMVPEALRPAIKVGALDWIKSDGTRYQVKDSLGSEPK
ncbi:MAG: ATP-dependent helicase [Polaromonas sp.]|uniref:UvrD-helicase domain-containing protein n=1 Tax=Polaromonas sp. TaxID=1869339 RepID=UPI0025CD08CE|nr:ATP-dependent helicase [Polaromonas sp.]MBI2727212.1 ATP-dependent helicase [Polaromonas sp.]